ncbi:MAG: methyltransferase domain-containing protein [Rubripirellula sp.]
MSNTLDTEQAVRERYSAAAEEREPQLCCPVDYDAQYLQVIPQEVIDRDYGCGDPSKYVGEGETVLDLGSGGGKICFIAAQVVGPSGKVIGVDMNDTMLQLARESQQEVAQKIGYDNIRFCKGKIQDMAIDRDAIDDYLKNNPVADENDLQKLEAFTADMRLQRPMIEDNSVDVVVSNCVLNLVDSTEKAQLFREIFRVLKIGGRAVISDIVCDEPVPPHMQADAELWSGCISGAFQEEEFLAAFEDAGFYGIEMPVLQEEPWQTVEGIEFRSATVVAYKGKEGPCDDYNEAVIYRGPFKKAIDDDGHVFKRGQRAAVCQKTFGIMTSPPYSDHFIPVPPHKAVAEQDAKPMSCNGVIRSPKVTKGKDYNLTVLGDNCCEPGGDCC